LLYSTRQYLDEEDSVRSNQGSRVSTFGYSSNKYHPHNHPIAAPIHDQHHPTYPTMNVNGPSSFHSTTDVTSQMQNKTRVIPVTVDKQILIMKIVYLNCYLYSYWLFDCCLYFLMAVPYRYRYILLIDCTTSNELSTRYFVTSTGSSLVVAYAAIRALADDL
jgi:hypothetical protein